MSKNRKKSGHREALCISDALADMLIVKMNAIIEAKK